MLNKGFNFKDLKNTYKLNSLYFFGRTFVRTSSFK